MALLTKQEAQAIADLLKARSTGGKGCMICGGFEWDLVDEEASLPLRPEPARRFVPCAASICRGCGLIALHSLIALGIRKADG